MALNGTLNYLEIAALLQVIGRSRKSGVLVITHGDRQAHLLFDRGALVCARSNRFQEEIGSLLAAAGLVSDTDVEKALNIQRARGGGRRLCSILSDEFGLRTQDIEEVLRCQFERIAFDVFSWPGGSFVFEFAEPSNITEHFRLDPADFILGVGIQGGLLAQEGAKRERTGVAHGGGTLPPE